ncbi:L-aspartate oxidase [Thermincola potens]|uniref:L-aspartate oxidase n=1 Tax=Thermincola potens (strain JR) TaxID=635013 RepID=D5X9N5_THEPJ|nr:L-aspartate oxidase [Thermincola potens]ADG81106.1 L-aspartate oxidase [Thermincola potens JR]
MIPRYIVNFDSRELPCQFTECLVIGSGIAGLYTAIRASNKLAVTVVTKKKRGDSNTELAQGGIAAAIHDADSPALHRMDTLEAGAGLCNEEAVEILVTEGPDRVRELIEMGANFDRHGKELAFTREAAHSRRRILHAGDSTGEEIQRTLNRKAEENTRITLLEDHSVIDLITVGGECLGALVWSEKEESLEIIYARAVVLATGGAGQIFKHTTNPEVATGDGVSIAYRAGAVVTDMEFIQFHPTALLLPGAPRFLISEAVRGEGAILRNIHGERFMPNYHPNAELASRDIVARAITSEMVRTGSNNVFLDLSPIDAEKVKKRFPNIAKTCGLYGIDIAREMIPVAPAAHYMMGGVKTNLNGETNIHGLYACGEVACEGVHGANRLASNSLLDGLVFGARIAEHIIRVLNKPMPNKVDVVFDRLKPGDVTIDYEWLRQQIREVMWDNVGIIRNESGLRQALDWFEKSEHILEQQIKDICYVPVVNMLVLGKLIANAALQRKESRGGHFREDYPCPDDEHWKRHIDLCKEDL